MTEAAARQQLSPEETARIAQQLFEGASQPKDRTYVELDGEKIPQLSKKKDRKRVRFYLDDDLFEGYSGLDAFTAMEFMDKADTWQDASTADEAKAILRELFQICLKPESYERFVIRLGDRENPVDVEELPEIIAYLFEAFGLRPTQLPSDSSGGPESQGTGTDSTDAPPSEASTSSPSPSTDF